MPNRSRRRQHQRNRIYMYNYNDTDVVVLYVTPSPTFCGEYKDQYIITPVRWSAIRCSHRKCTLRAIKQWHPFSFPSGTDLISLLILLLLGRPLQKCLRLRRFKSERNDGRNVLRISLNTLRLTQSIFDLASHFQDGGHEVISRRKVRPSGEWTRSVSPARMQQRPLGVSEKCCG